jgi:hypothetical protein
MLDLETVIRYLDMSKKIGSSCELIDVHAHPFELIYDDIQYNFTPESAGILSVDGKRYVKPAPTEMVFVPEEIEKKIPDVRLRQLFAAASVRRCYSHVGPRVFLDQMSLTGFSRSLLLPVARAENSGISQFERTVPLYGDCDSLAMAYCVPDEVENDQITSLLSDKLRQHNIRAVKIHPGISHIDSSSSHGIARIESILAACCEFRLPILIHSGRTPLPDGSGASEYGVIENLENVDWRSTDQPVVLSHGGAYGCKTNEVQEHVLPILCKLLERCDNMRIDTSGLGFEIVMALLKRVDQDRILFGSDTLYEAQWVAVVKVLHALTALGVPVEETFIQIASTNPVKTIMRYESGDGIG